MPWRIRWIIYMIVLGAAALALAIIVMVRAKSIDTELLAALGLVGAFAIVLNSMPHNGQNGNGWRDYGGERGTDRRKERRQERRNDREA